MNFHVGQLVVYVGCSGPFTKGLGKEKWPTKGTVYTVRALVTRWPQPAIRLAEIVNEPLAYGDGTYECAWWSGAFRPVDETRIAVFRQALAKLPTKTPIKAEAVGGDQ